MEFIELQGADKGGFVDRKRKRKRGRWLENHRVYLLLSGYIRRIFIHGFLDDGFGTN